MKIKLLSDGAIKPQRSSAHAAGYDLYIPHNTMIQPGRNIVPLDIAIEIPNGYEGHIRPRSGFASKGMEGVCECTFQLEDGPTTMRDVGRYDADVIQGTIDEDYRGNVGVIIKSNETEPFPIAKGTRIAQLVISPYFSEEIEIVDTLEDTERGEGGFGSTGTH